MIDWRPSLSEAVAERIPMNTLVHPGADLPGTTSMALEHPDGGERALGRGTTPVARLPREGTFAPSVFLSIETRPPSDDVEESLSQVRAVRVARSEWRGRAASDALVGSVLMTMRLRHWTPEAGKGTEP